MIAGTDVGLRAIERADLAPLLAWRNRPDFRRNFREFRELSMAQQERWYEERVLNDPATRMFAIVERASGRLLGACGLCYIDWVNRSADFSIYIGDGGAYIDDRFAPDAADALLGYAFEELGLHRVWCEIYDFDRAKQSLLPRLGFMIDGRHRETHWAEGAWHDSLFYGILERDWNAARLARERAA
ncbi:MAG TPA: GNAT family protein [Stellaceae bacterium]|nr:GNAT family protein [Stellaceae bacterium]